MIELSHASFSTLLHSPKRTVRKAAFHQYYSVFAGHQNALAASLAASVQRDIYYARARNYPSALEAALFPDRMPAGGLRQPHRLGPPPSAGRVSLLRPTAAKNAAPRYPSLRHLRADTGRSANTAQLESSGRSRHCRDRNPWAAIIAGRWKRACGRWCDRYENRGKQSGAFSSGSYDGDPYILMNYQPDVLDHVFTLAHEAGHSMHSLLSAKNQPYVYYQYVIFVAEVASTFNEQLLSRYLLDRARNDQERAFLINRQIDAMRGTIIRQTMFAEFEKIAHNSVESGEPLTLEKLQKIYRQLLKLYFGPDFTLDDELSLECLRIPHFYRAFYVYKYATGMSAAIALADSVLNGGKKELEAYLNFLKSGCSKDPLDLLRDAGVNMEKPAAVDTALTQFGKLVEELDGLL